MFNVIFEFFHFSIWMLAVFLIDVGASKLYNVITKKELHEYKSMATGFILAFPFSPAWYISLFWIILCVTLYALHTERDTIITKTKVKNPEHFHNGITFAVVLAFVGIHSIIV